MVFIIATWIDEDTKISKFQVGSPALYTQFLFWMYSVGLVTFQSWIMPPCLTTHLEYQPVPRATSWIFLSMSNLGKWDAAAFLYYLYAFSTSTPLNPQGHSRKFHILCHSLLRFKAIRIIINLHFRPLCKRMSLLGNVIVW